jgi:DNA uptake protein ComE-like DNA-binding protein
LKDIDGIGVYKAGAIVEFVTYNQDAEPEDLDVIDGIGEKTIEKVKEKYR